MIEFWQQTSWNVTNEPIPMLHIQAAGTYIVPIKTSGIVLQR